MTNEVRFDPAAERELNEAADYYDLETPGLGREFLDDVERTLRLIRDHPKASPVAFDAIRMRVLARFPFAVM
jgi:plasmid stabilization system protein ParE